MGGSLTTDYRYGQRPVGEYEDTNAHTYIHPGFWSGRMSTKLLHDRPHFLFEVIIDEFALGHIRFGWSLCLGLHRAKPGPGARAILFQK